ncbi:MAG: hypothetical protein K0Q68_1535 [Moraxellaceae bacterium]|jgi:signal transduction histidine kinase/CheY-like chemotaxis protein|nr:hypothetical protein [Moraxellaceae bacterium]
MDPLANGPGHLESEPVTPHRLAQKLAEEEERDRFARFLLAGALGTFAVAVALFVMKGLQPGLVAASLGLAQIGIRHLGLRWRHPRLLRWMKHSVLLAYAAGLLLIGMLTGQSQSFVLWFLVFIPVMAAFVNTPPTAGLWAAITVAGALAVGISEYWVVLPESMYTTPELRSFTRLVLIILVAVVSIRVRQTSDHRTYELAHSLCMESEAKRRAEHLQQVAEQARQTAEAASVTKARMLAFMSHEIRTPLNGVLGMNALLQDTPLTEQQRKYVALARQSGEVLLSLVNDFLDYSRLEAGRLPLDPTVFDPCQMVRDKVELLREGARQKGLELRYECSSPPVVRGDGARVRQILINLLGNAIKFTRQGEVVLRCMELSRSAEKVWLRLEVEDSGIGIVEEVQKKLFEPFVQADSSTTRRYGGTGLGLAICRALAEAMGGRIGVFSVPGQGSLFWVELPFELVPPEAWPAEFEPGPEDSMELVAPEKSGRVLLVEDNPVNQLTASEMLKRMGYRVEVVGNGQEAVDAVRQLDFDLVLMDCDMPVMSGYEAARRIREREGGGRRLPIVALTASALPGDRELCLAAGMDDYLPKPVRMGELGRAVKKWLRGR